MKCYKSIKTSLLNTIYIVLLSRYQNTVYLIHDLFGFTIECSSRDSVIHMYNHLNVITTEKVKLFPFSKIVIQQIVKCCRLVFYTCLIGVVKGGPA